MDMKGHIYTAAILLMVCLSSCSGLDEIKEGGGGIVLSGRIGLPLAQTRSGAVQGNDYGTLTLGMARVDTPAGNSADFSAVDASLEAEMTSDGSAVTLDPIVFTDSYQTFKNASDWVNYASWYPYADVEDGVVAFSVDGNTDILYGDIATGRSDTPFDPVTFNHAMVKFKVWIYAMVPKNNVTGEMAYDPDDVWGTISSLTVKDVPEHLDMALPTSSESRYVFTTSVEKADFVMSAAPKAGEGKLPFGAGTVLPSSFPLEIDERKAIAEFMIPPTSILSLNVTTTGPADGEAISQNISFAKDFKSGCHYDIVLRFSDHGLINAEVKVGEWTQNDVYANELTGDMFYDLSENETANCYVVSSANYNYCFNATVKGNGAEGVVDGTDVTIVPDHADILWADSGVLSDGTAPGFVLMNDGKISDGRVMFAVKGDDNNEIKTLKKEGNILLGVYDRNDNLVWTWHIWMCDPPQRQGYKNGFSVHDRDLGAVEYSPFEIISKGLEADAIDGLYYQWGRPTPLPFGRVLSNGADWGVDDTENVPLAERIVNPHKFYTTRLNEAALSKLWGWRSVSEEYVKTIYDPCPPGYRVPSNRLWRELKLDHEPHIGQNGNNHSIHFSVDDFNDIFYPVSGYYMAEGNVITNKDYSDDNTPGAAYMWAATYDSQNHNPYNLEFERRGATEVGDFSVTSDELHSYYALPVRCVSRKSTPHVEDLSVSQTANSYIVQDQGYFKFNVSVRGNGVGKLVSPGTAEFIDISEGLATDISGSIVKLKPLWWQEAGGVDMIGTDIPVILDDDGRVNDGYVMFHIDSFREGNLVLAGYDESETNILWTWHLWLTDTPEQLKSHNFAVMDRNLGATHAPSIGNDSSVAFGDAYEFYSTVGLYFQWGRKDPFVCPGKAYYYYDGASWSRKTGLMGYTDALEQKTIPYSVQNPMNFNRSSYDLGLIPTGTNNIGSWGYDYNANENQCFSTYRLPEARPSLWGYSSASGLGKTTTKTMYDPCPPGYCVAFYTVWTNDSQQYYTNLDSGYKSFPYTYSGGDKLINGYGIVVDRDNTFDPTWYPFSGYIDGKGNMTYYQTEGRFHSSTPAGNGSRSLYYTSQYTGQAVSSDYKGIPSSYAYPVRCQKQ